MKIAFVVICLAFIGTIFQEGATWRAIGRRKGYRIGSFVPAPPPPSPPRYGFNDFKEGIEYQPNYGFLDYGYEIPKIDKGGLKSDDVPLKYGPRVLNRRLY